MSRTGFTVQQTRPAGPATRRLPPVWMMAGAAALVAMIAIGAVTLGGPAEEAADFGIASGPPATADPKAPSPAPEPPPAAEPIVTVLRVTSDPPGANISLDGRDTREVTPAEIQLTGERPQRIRLAKSGFRPIDEGLTDGT
jgi:hypothetical protein